MTWLFIFYFNSCNKNNNHHQQSTVLVGVVVVALLEFTDLSFEIFFIISHLMKASYTSVRSANIVVLPGVSKKNKVIYYLLISIHKDKKKNP